MSNLGPFAIFSQDEITKFSEIARAQEAENISLVKLLASKLSPTEKDRYNQFADIAIAYSAEQDKSIAYHDAQIAMHQQRVDDAERKIEAVVHEYTPGYKAAMNQAAAGGNSAHAANNSRDNAAQPKKKKSGSNCTIV